MSNPDGYNLNQSFSLPEQYKKMSNQGYQIEVKQQKETASAILLDKPRRLIIKGKLDVKIPD